MSYPGEMFWFSELCCLLVLGFGVFSLQFGFTQCKGLFMHINKLSKTSSAHPINTQAIKHTVLSQRSNWQKWSSLMGKLLKSDLTTFLQKQTI